MKEATGEFSMTVVTILAVVVIAGLVAFLGPEITKFVKNKWNDIANNKVTPAIVLPLDNFYE